MLCQTIDLDHSEESGFHLEDNGITGEFKAGKGHDLHLIKKNPLAAVYRVHCTRIERMVHHDVLGPGPAQALEP